MKKDWPQSSFTYTTDGAFYTLVLTKDGQPAKFAEVFEAFSLQTVGSGNVHDFIGGSASLRSQADAGVDVSNPGTKFFDGDESLKSAKPNLAGSVLFYGIHSEIYGVNFEDGDQATIKVNSTLKAGIDGSDYNLVVNLYSPVRSNKNSKYSITEFENLDPLASVELDVE